MLECQQMTDSTIKKKALDALRKCAGLVDDEGNIDFPRLNDLIEKHKPEVIKPLLGDKDLKARFFVKVAGAWLFKANDFRFFLEENQVNNSYTKYRNMLGLSGSGRLLKDVDEIVLDFPFKDCVLSGGQISEDDDEIHYQYQGQGNYSKVKSRRQEVFFNQVIAIEEIDRLLDPKAFTGWARYPAKGGGGGGGGYAPQSMTI